MFNLRGIGGRITKPAVAAKAKELTAADMPEFISAIDQDTMEARGTYGQKLSDIALGEGPTSMAQAQLEAQKLEEAGLKDQAAQQSSSALAQARRAMAMRGGAGGGSAERMASQGAKDLMMARQNVSRSGAQQRGNILAQDQDTKFKTLGGLQDMAVQQLGGLNQARQAAFAKQMEVQSSDKLAAAQRAASGKCFLPDTFIKMQDGSFKKIKDIVVGDECFLGGKVYETISSERMGIVYNYHGVYVTGEHAVLEKGTFLRVKDSREAVPVFRDSFVVFNLNNKFHRIVTKEGIVFSDNIEVEGVSNYEESIEMLNASGM